MENTEQKVFVNDELFSIFDKLTDLTRIMTQERNGFAETLFVSKKQVANGWANWGKESEPDLTSSYGFYDLISYLTNFKYENDNSDIFKIEIITFRPFGFILKIKNTQESMDKAIEILKQFEGINE